jgi:hypothetical protein
VIGLSIYINNIVEYIDIGGLHAPVVGGLRIYGNNNVKYLDLEGASCPGDRIKCFDQNYCRI